MFIYPLVPISRLWIAGKVHVVTPKFWAMWLGYVVLSICIGLGLLRLRRWGAFGAMGFAAIGLAKPLGLSNVVELAVLALVGLSLQEFYHREGDMHDNTDS